MNDSAGFQRPRQLQGEWGQFFFETMLFPLFQDVGTFSAGSFEELWAMDETTPSCVPCHHVRRRAARHLVHPKHLLGELRRAELVQRGASSLPPIVSDG